MIYEPREDSFLLQKFVTKYARGKVLDVGTGSGIQALTAANKASLVLAVDINPEAVDYCKKNVQNKKIQFKKSDLFENVDGRYNTIIFNPPYLPEDKREPKDSQLSTTGGKKGHEILERFFSQVDSYLAKDGKILIVVSSLTKKVEEIIANYCFDFKKLGSKKIPFETLYVYLAEKSEILKSLGNVRNVKKIARGHRGIVYSADFNNRRIAVKVDGNSGAVNRINNEVKWLTALNKQGIGPKLLFSGKDYFGMEFVDGNTIWEFIARSSKNEIRRVIKDVFEQCYTMDNMQINKEEMHRPVKHIIITNTGVTMIDFERTRKILRPQNVTQFCQFLTSGSFAYGLENKGLVINKRLLKLAKKYKDNPCRKNFEMLLEEI